MDINAEAKYPLNLGNPKPDSVRDIAIPIPVSALDSQLNFTGTPTGENSARLVYFMLQMCFDRFSRKRKPKAPKRNAPADVTLAAPAGAPTTAEGEATSEQSEDDEDESDLDEDDEAAEHARNMTLPTADNTVAAANNPVNANPSTAELEAMDHGDEAYEILMNHEGRKWRKVRIFLETVVHGRGVICGYVLWFCFYEQNLYNRMFLSFLGYNQAFAAKNAPALDKMRAKPNDYGIATRKSIEINSVTSYKDCIRQIVGGKIALADRQLTNMELVRDDCPYNLINVFCLANIERFFPGSWNFNNALNASQNTNRPSHPRYPWLIMEVPDSLMDNPNQFVQVPIDTLLREEVIKILRPTCGAITPALNDEINAFVSSMPNVMQQRINEEINRLLEQRDYVYRTSNIIKDMREHGATDADVEQYFRDRFTTIHHELFRNTSSGNINCSQAEYVALRDAPSVTLPRSSEPFLFPHRSSLPLRSDMLRQFLETLVRHCFMHKGDRLNQAVSVYLASLPCDSAYTLDEVVLGLFGEKETGKSTAHILREHMTTEKRVKRMDAVTPKTFEINDNWNNHIMLFDEVSATVLGIEPTGSAGKGANTGNALVNAQKQMFTGGYHTGTYFMSDSTDRASRSNGTYMLTGAGSWIFSQNLGMNIVHMSPLISRYCLFHNQYFSRSFADPDSTSNNDNGLTRDMEASVGPYGRRFLKFMKKIDLIMLIYCVYVKMGCFETMDMTFARCVMNAMNDQLAKKHMRKYSNRLGDRLRTMIRRTDIWLSILTFFASGLSLQLLPNKTHLDFDVLIQLNKYIHANGCSAQAICYVLTLFSTEIIVDTSHIVRDALKSYFDDFPEKFPPSETDVSYVKPPFRSKADMAKWLTETTGINAMDAPNALFNLTKTAPMDDTGITLYRPMIYAESHIAAYLIHRHFLTNDGPHIREDFTNILHQSMCLERSSCQVVLTSFHHQHLVSDKHIVTLGAIHRCLVIQPLRGRYLVLHKHNPNEEDVDHPTIIEYITNDFVIPRDTTLCNVDTPVVENIPRPDYPSEFAYSYYSKLMERRREMSFLTEASSCIPSYCVTADVMLLDEASASLELDTRIQRLFPNTVLAEKFQELFVAQTEWYRLLHRQWKMNFHYLQWLQYAVRKMKTSEKEDWMSAAKEVELEIQDTSTSSDVSYAATVVLFNRLKSLRTLLGDHPNFESVFGHLAETVADAIPLPPWYYVMQCEMLFHCYRPSFLSVTAIEMLRLMGTPQEKATIASMENAVVNALARNEKKSIVSYAALPTTTSIARYDVNRSTKEHLPISSTIAFWSKQHGGKYAALLHDFVRVRSTWCRLRHMYGMMLEYKMICVLYVLSQNRLYANIAFDRVQLLQKQLLNEPLPEALEEHVITPPAILPPPPLNLLGMLDAVPSDLIPPPAEVELVECPAMSKVFLQMRSMYEYCRNGMGASIFREILKDGGEEGDIARDSTMTQTLTNELKTTVFKQYGDVFDAQLKTHADLENPTIHTTLSANVFLTTNAYKDIKEEFIRSFATFSKHEASKRWMNSGTITTQNALCKKRMIAFQKK